MRERKYTLHENAKRYFENRSFLNEENNNKMATKSVLCPLFRRLGCFFAQCDHHICGVGSNNSHLHTDEMQKR